MLTLHIADDFDLAKIADSGQCFRWERAGGGFRIPHRGCCLVIEEAGQGAFDLICGREEYEAIWAPYFDMQEDYRAIRARIGGWGVPFLSEAAGRGRGIRILRQDPFEALISFIISQNKNIPAIKSCVAGLCALFGEEREDARGERFYVFPPPERLAAADEEALRSCALGYRSAYVLAAAREVAEGKLNLAALGEAPLCEVLDRLKRLSGVGEKVAACAALYGMHQMDAFPVDVWMRRILEEKFPEGYPYGRLSPYNGYWQQVMFYTYRTP